MFLLALGAQVGAALLGQRPAPGVVPGGCLPSRSPDVPTRGAGGSYSFTSSPALLDAGHPRGREAVSRRGFDLRFLDDQ